MKVALITGSRADWNGLGMVAKAFKADPRFSVSIIATGQHIEDGTADLIRADSLLVSAFCGMRRRGDTPALIAEAIGNGVGRIADALETLRPDLVALLGDRYEILSAATAAATLRIAIAHLSGGDATEGSLDDKFRNAITALADLHFPTHDGAAVRITRMVHYPRLKFVWPVGAPALDRIRETPVAMDKKEFCRLTGLDPARKNILVLFHPVTTDADPAAQCREMVSALMEINADYLVIGTNSDAGGSAVGAALGELPGPHFENLPAPVFYAALTHMDLMVGNSSAGIYETAGFGIPVVNVGNRQTGRAAPENVLSCPPNAGAIQIAIAEQLRRGRQPCINPYGDGHSSARIVEIVAKHFGL